VTPDHSSLLIDTGWAGDGSGFHPGEPHRARDANRIAAAARDAGIQQIDYLLLTHYHSDHDGGVLELSKLMPIRTFIDHVPPPAAKSGSSDMQDAIKEYAAVRGNHPHLQPVPGERLPLRDIEATVVSSAGATLTNPLAGAGESNPKCEAQPTPPRDEEENPRSTGVLIQYGHFRFLDVGDLTGRPLFNLACPKDLIGPVDVYLVAHHGGPDTMIAETFVAFRPRVAIMNNGLKKGGARVTYEALHHVSGLENVWQLHASGDAGESNFAPEYIANVDESTANWIKLIANPDGSFAVLNPRTTQRKNYSSLPAR